jgi:hypothetical protein
LALVAERPNLTVEEVVEAVQKQRIVSSRTTVWCRVPMAARRRSWRALA